MEGYSGTACMSIIVRCGQPKSLTVRTKVVRSAVNNDVVDDDFLCDATNVIFTVTASK